MQIALYLRTKSSFSGKDIHGQDDQSTIFTVAKVDKPKIKILVA